MVPKNFTSYAKRISLFPCKQSKTWEYIEFLNGIACINGEWLYEPDEPITEESCNAQFEYPLGLVN